MEDEILQQMVPRVSIKTNASNEFSIRLARDISRPDDFAEEFHALQCATEEDVVHMDIVSVGGSMDTCIMMRRAMANCRAPIYGWIGPTCASAAGAIALACDGWEIDEMSCLMIHTASFGPGFGKAPDIMISAQQSVKMIERFVRLVYTGFLTEDEIVRVLDGKDMYFDGEDLHNRLQTYAEYRRAQQEAEYQRAIGAEGEEDPLDY